MMKVHDSNEFTTVDLERFTVDKNSNRNSGFSVVKANMNLQNR